MAKERKKFKDTKVGKFLKRNGSNILDVVGDVIPEEQTGFLGIVKNLIDRDPDMTAEQKMEAEKLMHEQEMELKKLNVEDRKSAREREVSWINVFKKRDTMQTITGAAGLLAFIFVVVALVFIEIPENNAKIFYIIVGMISTFAGAVFNYYFGSSKGSSDKNKLFNR